MSKTTIVLLAGLLNLFNVAAQDFRPGFVLKLNGDSVAGFIQYGSSKANSRFCNFKPTKNGEKIKYAPEDIHGYGINDDKFYEARNISKKGSEFYFLEVLVRGKVSLYKNIRVYYLEKDSLFILSDAPQSVVNVDGVTYNSSTLKYMGVLNYVLSDCNLKADKVAYQDKALTNLIQNYNQCKGALGLTYKSKKPWTKFSGSILTGVDLATVQLDGFNTYSFKQSVSVPLGVGIELSAPRWSEKNFLSLELWYDKKFYQGYSETSSNGSTTRSDASLATSFIKMPVGFRHNFLKEINTPYIRFGLVHYFMIKATGTVLSETENNGVVITDRSDAVINKKNTNGYWAGVGYSMKVGGRFLALIEARYEKNNGFSSPTPGSNSSGSTTNFLIGLRF